MCLVDALRIMTAQNRSQCFIQMVLLGWEHLHLNLKVLVLHLFWLLRLVPSASHWVLRLQVLCLFVLKALQVSPGIRDRTVNARGEIQ